MVTLMYVLRDCSLTAGIVIDGERRETEQEEASIRIWLKPRPSRTLPHLDDSLAPATACKFTWRGPRTPQVAQLTTTPPCRPLSHVPAHERLDESHKNYVSSTIYGSALAADGIPRFELPDGEMPAKQAARFV